jgi:hypothetical protein
MANANKKSEPNGSLFLIFLLFHSPLDVEAGHFDLAVGADGESTKQICIG